MAGEETALGRPGRPARLVQWTSGVWVEYLAPPGVCLTVGMCLLHSSGAEILGSSNRPHLVTRTCSVTLIALFLKCRVYRRGMLLVTQKKWPERGRLASVSPKA